MSNAQEGWLASEITETIEDADEKMRFFLREAENALSSTLGAYDALSSKAFTLFSIEVTILPALLVYLLFQFDPRSLLTWAAVVYALSLIASGVFCWLISAVKPLAHTGKPRMSSRSRI
jgi:Trk-type K+ transport system membrane component